MSSLSRIDRIEGSMTKIMHSNTKSYLTNFSSVHSPGTGSSSSIVQPRETHYKKQASTFLESNNSSSILSQGEKRTKVEESKENSTSKLLKNKIVSMNAIKSTAEKESVVKNSKAFQKKRSKVNFVSASQIWFTSHSHFCSPCCSF